MISYDFCEVQVDIAKYASRNLYIYGIRLWWFVGVGRLVKTQFQAYNPHDEAFHLAK